MDRKPESETLRQQRKAQRDLIELKKAEQNGERPEHIAYQEEQRPQGFAERAEHFWYYYKVPVLGVLIAAVLIAFFCVQCAMNPKKDVRIALFDYHYVSEMHIAAMQDQFAGVCEDFDGNGQALVEIINCSFETGVSTAEQQQIKMQKLQALVAADTKTSLFITSPDTWAYLSGLSDTGLLYEYHPFTQAFYDLIDGQPDFPTPQNLGIAAKCIDGTLMEENEEAIEAGRRAGLLLEALKQANWIE